MTCFRLLPLFVDLCRSCRCRFLSCFWLTRPTIQAGKTFNFRFPHQSLLGHSLSWDTQIPKRTNRRQTDPTMETPKYFLNASHVFINLVVTFNAIFHCHGCWPQQEKQSFCKLERFALEVQQFWISFPFHHQTKAQTASLPRLLAVCFAARCSLYCCFYCCKVPRDFFFFVLFPKCDKRCLSLESCTVKGCNAEKVRSASQGKCRGDTVMRWCICAKTTCPRNAFTFIPPPPSYTVEDEDSISDVKFSTSTGYDDMTQLPGSVWGLGFGLSRAGKQDDVPHGGGTWSCDWPVNCHVACAFYFIDVQYGDVRSVRVVSQYFIMVFSIIQMYTWLTRGVCGFMMIYFVDVSFHEGFLFFCFFFRAWRHRTCTAKLGKLRRCTGWPPEWDIASPWCGYEEQNWTKNWERLDLGRQKHLFWKMFCLTYQWCILWYNV